MYGIPIKEDSDTKTSQRDLLRKYADLTILSQFLKSFDMSVFGKLQQVNESLDVQGDFRDEQVLEQEMDDDID